MGCFPCAGNSDKRLGRDKTQTNNRNRRDDRAQSTSEKLKSGPHKCEKNPKAVDQSSAAKELDVRKEEVSENGGTEGFKARPFTFAQLVAATENFKSEYFLGEGGFGKVHRGKLVDTGQIVAIKQLDRNGMQGIREFVVEVVTLSLADHPNLVKLIGYCAEGEQRLLVYEFMPFGSLEDHLHGRRPNMRRLDWNTRMKIAAGAAKGLEYLHDKMKPPVIYRDLKCSNILLDEGFLPKLSDFGLAKARPLFKDRKKFPQMADPDLEGQYPMRGLYQALAIAAMCVQEHPNMRPLIADIVTALNYLASQTYDPRNPSPQTSRRAASSKKDCEEGPDASYGPRGIKPED
ncbi:hypothetical protein RHGRI_036460 [Rhododendron griersonianum]|uniref:Protein kinase domain-containing protein n=1 Tax=Rhododendron griersonianum TaxID=479676 RepID=A0AAV6HN19_9ERIC|nr:hypothetical protein RHGRI_036460 [Rhododendron griersonianum]KAG5515414.1 hypothetical protein RHGRI_036460 [Rhododendron griersonianum]KAG5515415.1 hypothetical protein RHGRI_036460 [Rhododendron griersonianum]